MKILKGKVVNTVEASTRFGQRLVLNCKLLDSNEKAACWSTDLSNELYLSKKPGDIVELIQDEKGKFSLLHREETTQNNITMNRPSSNGSESSYYTYSSNTKESLKEASYDLLQELPILSANDKKKVALLIQQQSKLLKYCCDCIANDFPNVDERSQRSLGVSLFINSQITINKNM